MFEALIPLHPKLVHYPIALFTTAFLLEIISRVTKKDNLSQTAYIMFIIAVLVMPLVFYSGLWEQTRLKLDHPLLTKHKTFALSLLWMSGVSLVALLLAQKKSPKYFRNLFLIILFLINITVFVTAHYGGDLVYEYGVATQ